MKRILSAALALLILACPLARAEELYNLAQATIADARIADYYLADEYFYRQAAFMVERDAPASIGANAYAADGLLVLHVPADVQDIHPQAFSGVNHLLLVAEDNSYAARFAAANGYAQITPAEWTQLTDARLSTGAEEMQALRQQAKAGLNAPPAPETIPIGDIALEEAIRTDLGLEPDAPITADVLAQVTRLEIRDWGVNEDALAVLRYCTSLDELILSGCEIRNADVLSQVPSLRILNLEDNELETIDLANALTGLEELNLLKNPLHSICGVDSLLDAPMDKLRLVNNTNDSDMVRQLQALLIEKNCLYDNADGDFGEKTREALRRLQEVNGLNATGNLDDATLRALISGSAAEFEGQRVMGLGNILYNVYADASGSIRFRVKNIGLRACEEYSFRGLMKAGSDWDHWNEWEWTPESPVDPGASAGVMLDGFTNDVGPLDARFCVQTVTQNGSRLTGMGISTYVNAFYE